MYFIFTSDTNFRIFWDGSARAAEIVENEPAKLANFELYHSTFAVPQISDIDIVVLL